MFNGVICSRPSAFDLNDEFCDYFKNIEQNKLSTITLDLSDVPRCSKREFIVSREVFCESYLSKLEFTEHKRRFYGFCSFFVTFSF